MGQPVEQALEKIGCQLIPAQVERREDSDHRQGRVTAVAGRASRKILAMGGSVRDHGARSRHRQVTRLPNHGDQKRLPVGIPQRDRPDGARLRTFRKDAEKAPRRVAGTRIVAQRDGSCHRNRVGAHMARQAFDGPFGTGHCFLVAAGLPKAEGAPAIDIVEVGGPGIALLGTVEVLQRRFDFAGHGMNPAAGAPGHARQGVHPHRLVHRAKGGIEILGHVHRGPGADGNRLGIVPAQRNGAVGHEQGLVPLVLDSAMAKAGPRPGGAAQRLGEAAIQRDGAVEVREREGVVSRCCGKTFDDTCMIMVPGATILNRQSQRVCPGFVDQRLGQTNGEPGRGILDHGERIDARVFDISTRQQ